MTGAFGGGWGGDSVDLTDNAVSEGMPLLKTGVYDAVSCDVETKDHKNGKMLIVTFNDKGGTGQIKFNFNYIHSSADAQRIGRDQMKTFLTHGGHTDPNHPFNHPKEAMLGLGVRIFVEHDGIYVKNNKTYDSYRIARFAPIDPSSPAPGVSANPVPAGRGAASASSGSTGSGTTAGRSLDDDIPF